MNSDSQMETLVVRITPAWKRELENMKAERAVEGSVISLSEIVRQQLSPWLKERIAHRELIEGNGRLGLVDTEGQMV
ncbi:MAG: hypothetical protein ACAI35_15685 [Candidatus Methylacidiphilales bacterium]|nr:hypothetical protein [Candidatus Methylacidiphilales bacterium]